MKLLFIIFLFLANQAYSDVLVNSSSWLKDAPKGKNLIRVDPGDSLELISDKNVKGYILVRSNSTEGWIYYNRVSIRPDFKLTQCGTNSPYGFPITTIKIDIICRSGYTIGFDSNAKIPTWVAYKVSVSNSHSSNVPRSNSFYQDNAIAKDLQASGDDYYKSGYDKGHMAPSASLDASRDMNDSTYVYTNMVPQLPGFNRNMMGYKGVWGKLESVIRSLAYRQDLYVLSGSYYGSKSKRINNNVVVPDAFYKIIFNDSGELVGAFWMDHVAGGSDSWAQYSTSIDSIELKIGADLFPGLDQQYDIESSIIKF
jgi:endonuclease G